MDKTGLPYVFHPFHLAEQMDDEISTACALLHDVIKDTPITLAHLREMGFPQEVLDVLALLTHDEATPYMEYVKMIGTHPIAKKVKRADLMHNSDITRLDLVDEKALKRNQKYQEALRILAD